MYFSPFGLIIMNRIKLNGVIRSKAGAVEVLKDFIVLKRPALYSSLQGSLGGKSKGTTKTSVNST